jgi:hypothetical protein
MVSVRQPAGATSDGEPADDVCELEAAVLLGVTLCVAEGDGEADAELLTGVALILALELALALCETSAAAA